ncbi:MAG: ATP-binding cassette domain-containing protein [Oscillospiraceae bacterium]|jgi:putative ABC transport system ATP-binding protein|nr:ATP-binding cassette domain-containing protein [Oscillospiraceae bacterium]
MLLETIDLTKSYERRGERFYAAYNVALSVESDDFVCITGQSGSGKSTLLNLLAGLLHADSGSILLDGEDLCKLNDAGLAALRGSKIGYIPQGNSLLQNFSVLDNVCLPWYLTRKSNVRAQARELLARVGIAHLERENPASLSGGEARRVAIARSLIANPSVLIADEPTGDLDPKTTDDIIRMFSEVHAQGVAVVVVTHEREIPSFTTKHYVMENGHLALQ